MKTLTLNLKAEWYDMIEAGIKTEEYREIKPYWITRICENGDPSRQPIQFDIVNFVYGYTSRSMSFSVESVGMGKGRPEWGAPDDKIVFIIKLKKRIR